MSLQLVMYRGDDREFEIALTENDLPIDLTGAAIVFTARADLDDPDPAFSLSSTDGDIVINPDQVGAGKGKFTLTVPSAATIDLEPVEPKRAITLLCDVEVTVGGAVRTWPDADYGQSTLIRLRVRSDVTHP